MESPRVAESYFDDSTTDLLRKAYPEFVWKINEELNGQIIASGHPVKCIQNSRFMQSFMETLVKFVEKPEICTLKELTKAMFLVEKIDDKNSLTGEPESFVVLKMRKDMLFDDEKPAFGYLSGKVRLNTSIERQLDDDGFGYRNAQRNKPFIFGVPYAMDEKNRFIFCFIKCYESDLYTFNNKIEKQKYFND